MAYRTGTGDQQASEPVSSGDIVMLPRPWFLPLTCSIFDDLSLILRLALCLLPGWLSIVASFLLYLQRESKEREKKNREGERKDRKTEK